MACCARRPPPAPLPRLWLLRGAPLPLLAADLPALRRWARLVLPAEEAQELPSQARMAAALAVAQGHLQAGHPVLLHVPSLDWPAFTAHLPFDAPVATALLYLPLSRLATAALPPEDLVRALVEFGVVMKGSKVRTAATVDVLQPPDIVAAGQRVPNPQQTAVCHFLRLALGVAGDDEPVYLEPREENHVVLHCRHQGQAASRLLAAARSPLAPLARPPTPAIARCGPCARQGEWCAACLHLAGERLGQRDNDLRGSNLALAMSPDFFSAQQPLPDRAADGGFEVRCPPATTEASLPPTGAAFWCALGGGYIRFRLALPAWGRDNPAGLGLSLMAWGQLACGDLSMMDTWKVAFEQGFTISGCKAGRSFVLVAKSADSVVLAFRGTASADVAIQVDVLGSLSREADVAGVVHSGFRAHLDALYDDLVRFLARTLKGRTLFITGHSLGGAVATLLCARLCGRYHFADLGVLPTTDLRPFAVYTYGSPRCGDADFARFVEEHAAGRLFRYLNQHDPIPDSIQQDFGPLGQYRHCGAPRCVPNAFRPCAVNLQPGCYWPHQFLAYYSCLEAALAAGRSLDPAANPGFTGLDTEG